MSEYAQGKLEMETTHETKGLYVGRLGDLGLGNPEGIPSRYAEYSKEQLDEIAEQNARSLTEPTDLSCTACIDGRCTLHNADGSPAEVRKRRVGGSASNLGVMLNADASVTATFDMNASIGELVQIADDAAGERSAHTGGCGGANGEITDNELIATEPKIMAAVKALMAIPAVREALGFDYSEVLGQRVVDNAGKTAVFLRAKGWDGQRYVDGVLAQNPRGVEELEVDHDDHKFHGHKEPSVSIVLGNKTMPLDHDGFVWNVEATLEFAEQVAGQRGDEGFQQAVIADIAKHMAVCKRLPSEETPVFLLGEKSDFALTA